VRIVLIGRKYEEAHRKRAKHTASRQREMTRGDERGDEVKKDDQNMI
jgi:hypothetical protein